MYEQVLDGRTIRLLELQPGLEEEQIVCHLRIVTLDEKPAYEALSYAWGDPTPVCSIIGDGQDVLIAQNLYNALRRLRLTEAARIIWVDALCINQSNHSEKSHQVRLMADIYENAQRTVVYLGEHLTDPDDPDTDVRPALDLIRLISARWEAAEGFPKPHSKVFESAVIEMGLPGLDSPAWKALRELRERPWWKRTWIVQEVALARDILVVVGNSPLLWLQFTNAAELLGVLVFLMKPARLEYEFNIVRELNVRPKTDQGDPTSLFTLVQLFRTSECSDAHDKIYALSGLAARYEVDERLRFGIIDYNMPVCLLYTSFTLYCIARTGDLRIFLDLKSQDFDIDFDSDNRTMPSWAVDWSYPLRQSLRLDVFSSSGSRKLCLRRPGSLLLGLRGLFVDRISEVGDRLEYTQSLKGQMPKVIKWLLLAHKIQTVYCKGNGDVIAHIVGQYQMVFDGKDTSPFEEVFGILLRSLDVLLDTSPVKALEERYSLIRVLLDDDQFTEKYLACIVDGDISVVNSVVWIAQLIYSYSRSTSLFLTKTGFIGCGIRPKAGDLVCILYGGSCPYVLRKNKNQSTYEMIGPCYVSGLMEGEALEMEGVEELDFVLQ